MTTVLELPSVGSYRPEIDVYKDPHLRMKHLINSTTEIMLDMQEALRVQTSRLEDLLQEVYLVMWEFKSHEFIENTFIMEKLKAKLRAQQVYNKLVCNCHNDSELYNIIVLVEKVYAADNDFDRIHNGELLQVALSEFLSEMMPHMEEEEAIFQPLLAKYFDYEELKELKVTVLEQHKLWKEKVEAEKKLKKGKDEQNMEIQKRLYFELQQLDTPVNSYCKEMANLGFETTPTIGDMPEEILTLIFGFLNPKELIQAGTVSRIWLTLSRRSSLWRNILATQWMRGQWTFQEIVNDHPLDDVRDRKAKDKILFDEDADVDESDWSDSDSSSGSVDSHKRQVNFYTGLVQHLLPEVGSGVVKVVVTDSVFISNQHLRKIIKMCPRLEILDCSYTNVTDAAFKGLSADASLRELQKLDLTGCSLLTDTAIERISSCFMFHKKMDRVPKVTWISASGCKLLTEKIFGYMEVLKPCLEYLDLSGCSRINGRRMVSFVEGCPKLSPENLYYCSTIEDGPYPNNANGCQNLECSFRSCCQQIRN